MIVLATMWLLLQHKKSFMWRRTMRTNICSYDWFSRCDSNEKKSEAMKNFIFCVGASFMCNEQHLWSKRVDRQLSHGSFRLFTEEVRTVKKFTVLLSGISLKICLHPNSEHAQTSVVSKTVTSNFHTIQQFLANWTFC